VRIAAEKSPREGHGRAARELVQRNEEMRLESRATVPVHHELCEPRDEQRDGDEREERGQRDSAERWRCRAIHERNLLKTILVKVGQTAYRTRKIAGLFGDFEGAE
jgi:hypothetical protein